VIGFRLEGLIAGHHVDIRNAKFTLSDHFNTLDLTPQWQKVDCETYVILIYQNGICENFEANEPGGQPVPAGLNIMKQNLSHHIGWVLSNQFPFTLQDYSR
jgi:hypothetical protein